MANITIKELLAADKVSDLVDKINFNFDQLLLNGGGPRGVNGGPGDIGPIGPRGTLWFTVADLFTTETSPGWTGSTEMVNDINSSSYPQYTGDPNQYLPVGNGMSPDNTFMMGNNNKFLRDGDLFIQETDDIFDGFNSTDGDIWEYDGITLEWIFTGVNIKGNTGNTGAEGDQQWIRQEETTSNNDILYPKRITGRSIPKILIGTDINIHNSTEFNAISTFVSDSTKQISLANNDIHVATNIATPSLWVTTTGVLVLEGSGKDEFHELNYNLDNDILIQTHKGKITLQTDAGLSYNLNVGDMLHDFHGGELYVTSKKNNSNHQFKTDDTKRTLNIEVDNTNNHHSISSSTEGFPGGILSHLILQDNEKSVGIGQGFGDSILSKFAVSGNAVIGRNFKMKSAPIDGMLIQSQLGVGRDTVLGDNSIQTTKAVSTDDGIFVLNGYYKSGWKHTNANTAGILRTDSDNYKGIDLLVSDNMIAGGLMNQIKAFHVTADTINSTGQKIGNVGFNTNMPVEKVHIHNEKLFITPEHINNNGLKTWVEHVGNGIKSHVNLTGVSADLENKMYYYVNNNVSNMGVDPNMTMQSSLHNSKWYRKNGINTDSPKSTFEVRGESKRDSIMMGDFNNEIINNIKEGDGIYGNSSKNGASWLGFNAYVENWSKSVEFKDTTSREETGALLFMDADGNIHLAMKKGLLKTINTGGGINTYIGPIGMTP